MHTRNLTSSRRKVDRIVFRTGRGLGDAVLCEPLVHAVADAFPGVELTVLLPRSCDELPLLGFAGDRFHPWLEEEPFTSVVAKYDLAIDADPAAYDKEFESVDEAGRTVVRLFAHYQPDATETTAYDRMADGLARIGIDAVGATPALSVPAAVKESAADLLSGAGRRSGRMTVVIHPGSNQGYSHKRWAPEGFAYVGNEFIERYDAQVVYVGSGFEDDLLGYIQSRMPHGEVAAFVRDWRLPHLAALLDVADLFIGNDSGVGHLAAALGRPVVTVAGPTYPHFWAPLTDRALVTDPAGCCYNPTACGVRCLKAIRGCDVLCAAEALLTATTKREKYLCLDPIRLADNLSVTDGADGAIVLFSEPWRMPMTIKSGGDAVFEFLDTVRATGSSKVARSLFSDADLLLEQCIRHAIVLPNANPQISARYVT